MFGFFRRVAFLTTFAGILGVLYQTGVFAGLEDYMGDVRSKITEGARMWIIRSGGFLSLTYMVYRSLCQVHPIIFLVFFSLLYAHYSNRVIFDDPVILDKAEILEDILQNDWLVVGDEDEWEVIDKDEWEVLDEDEWEVIG